jgi:GTPase
VSLATVAIVGRPNVGKSTLFNRLVGRRLAITSDIAGVTRDRRYGEVEWLGRTFRIVDTGGLVSGSTSTLIAAVGEQTERALVEADVVLFVLDGRQGVTIADQEIAGQLRTLGKKVLLVANKIETVQGQFGAFSAYQLGFGDLICISAEHGQGIGELLDALMPILPENSGVTSSVETTQVAIVGRPNVGKSSLVNRLLREDRLLVDAFPGTTRDAIDSQVYVNKKCYTLVDTAGMRKARRIGEALEKVTVAVTLRCIQRCDVAILLLDALSDIGEQDIRIGTYIEQQGKACVIAINKWDAVAKTTQTYETFLGAIRESMPFLSHVPVLSLSALTGQRVTKLFPLIDQVYTEARRRLPTAQLNEFLKKVTQQRSAPAYRGQLVKFSFLMQSLVSPPTFLCFVNRPEGVVQHYQRYLEHQLRETFGFSGTPIRIFFRKK